MRRFCILTFAVLMYATYCLADDYDKDACTSITSIFRTTRAITVWYAMLLAP